MAGQTTGVHSELGGGGGVDVGHAFVLVSFQRTILQFEWQAVAFIHQILQH